MPEASMPSPEESMIVRSLCGHLRQKVALGSDLNPGRGMLLPTCMPPRSKCLTVAWDLGPDAEGSRTARTWLCQHGPVVKI